MGPGTQNAGKPVAVPVHEQHPRLVVRFALIRVWADKHTTCVPAAGFLFCALAAGIPAAGDRSGLAGSGLLLPPGLPAPLVPSGNPLTPEKIALGERLFFDTRLSVTGGYSCASCHKPERAFTDGLKTAIGATGQLHTRNTPSLYNSAYATSLGWADPDITTLEDQHLVPMFNTDPVELGLTEQNLPARLAQIGADPEIEQLRYAAFPNDQVKGLRLEQVTNALASFVRTLVAGNSAYDRYLFYDEPLPPPARRGLTLFFSERTGCAGCHASFNFSGPVRDAASPAARPVFHNTGLYNLRGTGEAPDPGLALVTQRPRDTGAFRAPSLRNVALTSPYMHDGSVANLDEVIAFYARGGRLIEDGPFAGDGRQSRYKRAEIRGFEMSSDERSDLIAFLESLTETHFVRSHTERSHTERSHTERKPGAASNADESFLSSSSNDSTGNE